jgi:hypothetical protein
MATEFKDNHDLIKAVGRALAGQIDPYTFGLILYGEDKRVDLGSGVGVTVGGRLFIATVAHNIQNREAHEIALVHTWKTNNVWTPIIGYGHSDDLDLAWLEVDPSHSFQDKRFLTVNRLGGQLGAEKRYFVHGFPAASAQVQDTSPQRTIALTSFGLFTTLHPDEIGDKEVDVYVVHERQGYRILDAEPMDVVDAPGMSGCGMWDVDLRQGEIWHPEECRLVAIQHSYKKGHYFRGIKVEKWLEMLRMKRPELFADVKEGNLTR